MPRRADIKKVLILGSGPIVIGQACEFDYSGTQACKALRAEGLEVILVNSNPATIMTDPEVATKTYIEPLTLPFLEKIIQKERPDGLIPTLGGQTALNAGLALADSGILSKYSVTMLGTTPEVIRKAEDRGLFKSIVDSVGGRVPKSHLVRNYADAIESARELGFPIILRPNYTLGGGGGGIAYSLEEYQKMIQTALAESPTSEVLVEQSILGWKEFELEVMRDSSGTFVVVCSIENIDPCGVHTGDSITVAPQQTLSDSQYQSMRDEARAITDAVGLETGGANIQFAVHPETGERVVIEMNPRVSRSSALASKATGFPIAKLAALLAIGYQLDEIQNDITKTTPACFEPALDYVVTKIPRFAFEKFSGARDILSTQMKSVGEVMGIGRTFLESFMKAIHSLELHPEGLPDIRVNRDLLSNPNSRGVFHVIQALRDGIDTEEVSRLTRINIWFLEQLSRLVATERLLAAQKIPDAELLRLAKRMGLSDARIGQLCGQSALEISELRRSLQIFPGFCQVDTCAGEFASSTPYFYSTYWSPRIEFLQPDEKKRVVVLGSGSNRIGQGVEFDYGCVRAVIAFRKANYNVTMINSNPETVSTDYDTSNQLFFEPLTVEHVTEVLNWVNPDGVATQWGGQTSLNLAKSLQDSGFKLLGSTSKVIDLAEDRALFGEVCNELGIAMPKGGMAGSLQQAQDLANRLSFPLLLRPSYVLGGRRMEVVESVREIEEYFEKYGDLIGADAPVLMDEFLERALEVDVDLVRSSSWALVGGVVEHIEAAGVHSGDSMGVLPPQRLKPQTLDKIESLSLALAERLGVIGHLNLQLAVKSDEVFVLEANPRSSRSVPFVAKATGIPIVDLAVLAILNSPKPAIPSWKSTAVVSVKGVVFPFRKFPETDNLLGPEMKSTGESMGRGKDYPEALLRAFISSQVKIPNNGTVFLSLRDKDKPLLLPLIRELKELGFSLVGTQGTADFVNENGVVCEYVRKVREGRPHCVDKIRSGEVSLVINTVSGRQAIEDSFGIRRSCVDYFIPCVTETDAAVALLLAIKRQRWGMIEVFPLPQYYEA